ncbi:hypothetical protein [Paenibacillus sinopodophylli]|uniref:hypothetical protein n=1 Tax=Paenibacillus sinopodophylli TaxID=1837342 RepID=UPI00110CCBE3|nr:hypothetical protein [Paenibacillus sinopodophylli]
MIRIDLNAIEAAKPKLSQGMQKCSQLNGSLSSTVYQVDSFIGARRSIRSRLDRTAQRMRELDQKLRELNTFVHGAQEQHSGLEQTLAQQAQALRREIEARYASMARAASDAEKGKEQLVLLALTLRLAFEWLETFIERFQPASGPLQQTGTGADEQPRFEYPNYDNRIIDEDVLNRNDPEVYKRLMAGRFGRLSEEEQRDWIIQAEQSKKEGERSNKEAYMGRSFETGFAYAMESSLLGLVDIVSQTASHPIQTVKALYKDMEDGIVNVVKDPIGAAKDGFSQAMWTFNDFIEGGPSKKGYYIGVLFAGLVFSRVVPKIPGLPGKGNKDKPESATGQGNGGTPTNPKPDQSVEKPFDKPSEKGREIEGDG